ncbi:nucleotidyltransferase [Tenacibaculum piscium]|uniref:nucleotidyltransferase n=1 Tax=Tenacibaculum piscium TaxID=1458515 RepID=UPI001F2F52E2|nr:nucleotidyltransferase [Tenacibaculum piscium]
MKVQEIKNKMIAVKENESSLKDLNSTSKVSIWNLFLFIVAFCFQDLRSYFDAHRKYIDYRLAHEKAGTLPWYRIMALAFQNGFDLSTDTDKFQNETATSEEIDASKIIKYATANDGEVAGTIVIKVATETNGKLSRITPQQEESLKQYFEEIKFAGDDITVINHLADKLFLTLKIYRDALVLDETGMSILHGNKPIEEALQQFMKELPFDGELILQSLVDKLQAIKGVKIAHIVEVKSSSLDASKDTHGTPQLIEVSKIPASGYFEIETFENISYVV